VPPGIDIKNTRYWALTGAYNAQVEEYKNQVKDLSQQVTRFASDNKEFREKITQYDKDNAEMKNAVASTVARVDALAERVDNADAAISDLQAGQAQTVKDIAALEAKDADLQRQITSNDTDISAIQAKDREQDARLSAIETVNDAQAATITQNTQDIARNTTNIQDNAANIAVNSKELAKHAEQLKDHAAQLSVLHKEVTDNHTAIERLTSVTDGLRADLTEDEAKIAQNADAIAHIQQKDVEQDGRLDALEGRATTAEGRLDALDTKTDATNTALTAETNRAKAAEVANGELIAANAQELARHSDELSDHERRISALETTTDGHTQSIADLKAKDAALDTAIAAVDDKVEHLELIDPKEYAKTIARIDAKDTAQDNKIHALETASNTHVTKTAFEASQKTQDDAIANLNTTKANKSDIPDVSGYVTKVYVDNQDATRIPFKTSNYDNAASSVALGVPTLDSGVWSIIGIFPYPVFSYKNRPGVNVDTTKGTLHLYKADGTEVTVPNWVTTGNVNNASGVIARMSPNFTPDSPFYVVVYRNNTDKYPTASDEPTA
jgi:chromosome segregation ATPase